MFAIEMAHKCSIWSLKFYFFFIYIFGSYSFGFFFFTFCFICLFSYILVPECLEREKVIGKKE
jgi:hypothetical protein